MPYSDQDKMISDLLASMNVGIDAPKDKTAINAQLAKQALTYKLLTPEFEDQVKSDSDADQAKRIKANSITAMGEAGTVKQDISGGNDFNLNNDDVAGMIQSLMS